MDLLLKARDLTREGQDVEVTLPDYSDQDLPQTLSVGGLPMWVQSDETPVCPFCNGPMRLLFQVESEVRHRGSKDYPEGVHLPFGGGGVAYAFICDAECTPDSTDVLWQCT
jgi:hypothetical protein